VVLLELSYMRYSNPKDSQIMDEKTFKEINKLEMHTYGVFNIPN
jgi:hypothetical protein